MRCSVPEGKEEGDLRVVEDERGRVVRYGFSFGETNRGAVSARELCGHLEVVSIKNREGAEFSVVCSLDWGVC